MIIDILCPTRGRPQLAARLYDSLVKTTKVPEQVRIWFYLSENDPEITHYNVNNSYILQKYTITGPDAPTAWIWNTLAEKATGDLLFLMGDDVVFETEGWDEIYREAASRYSDGIFVLAPDDGRGGGIPHPCVSKSWLEILNYFVNPVFLHWGVDSYTEHLANELGRLVRLPEVKITHQKVGEANPADETYKRLREGVWNARDLEVLDLMKSRYAEKDIELLKAASSMKKIFISGVEKPSHFIKKALGSGVKIPPLAEKYLDTMGDSIDNKPVIYYRGIPFIRTSPNRELCLLCFSGCDLADNGHRCGE